MNDTADTLMRGIAADAPFRIAVVRTSTLVQEACRVHALALGGAEALARALTGLSLMAVMDKDWYRLSAQWIGRGPLGTINVDVRSPGSVRGYLTGGGYIGPVSAGLEGGTLSVIRQKEGGQYAQGQAELVSHDVDGDLEGWMRQSDQLGTVLRVLVHDWVEGQPRSVTGVMVQELPGADRGDLEGAVSSSLLDRSLTPQGLLEELAASAAPGLGTIDWLGSTPLAWDCGCSAARVERGVKLLGVAEIDEMISLGEEPEVRCEYCATVYRMDLAALRRLKAELLAAG
ncbi:MAG: Hsp33 family molecular chaperone HslO [Deltaproteobacteria bacterium]|nr:Hsp33 family molecular chaperone HslO [Deltaproteobacteria bacterium]